MARGRWPGALGHIPHAHLSLAEAAEVFRRVGRAYQHLKERNEEVKENMSDDRDEGEKVDAFGKSKSGFKKSGNSLDDWLREVQEEGRRHRRRLREEEDRMGEHFIRINKEGKVFDERVVEDYIKGARQTRKPFSKTKTSVRRNL